MDVVRYDAETWAAIRRAWSETRLSLDQLTARHGPSATTIARRAKREGWGARGCGAAKRKADTPEWGGARFASDETWIEIRRCWEETTEPALRLAARFQVGYSTIAHRALKQGWKARPAKTGRSKAGAPQEVTDAVAAAARDGASDERLRSIALDAAKEADAEAARRLRTRDTDPHEKRLARSYRLIDMQIDQLEKLIMSGDDLSVQDQERVTRAVSTIVAKVEASGESALDHGKSSPGAGDPAERNHSIERMRREITERLERLNQEWLAQQKPR